MREEIRGARKNRRNWLGLGSGSLGSCSFPASPHSHPLAVFSSFPPLLAWFGAPRLVLLPLQHLH